LFWIGESISGFGSAITTVALPLVAVSTLRASTAAVRCSLRPPGVRSGPDRSTVFALRIVFLVRSEGAAAEIVGALISLGGLLGAARRAPRASRLAPRASRAVSRFGSARTYLTVNLATAPFMLLLPAGGPAGGWRLARFAAGSLVVMAGSGMSGVITVTFRSNYIPA